jgi:hypothetical protein
MKTLKTVLYIVVVLAIAASIALIVYDSTILNYFGIDNGPDFWKAWLTGIVALFALTAIIENAESAVLSKTIHKKNEEINEVKIKFFDEVTNRNAESTATRETPDRAPLRREEKPDIRIVPKSNDSPLR